MDFSFLKTPEFWVCTAILPYLIQKYYTEIDRAVTLAFQAVIFTLPLSIRSFFRNRKAKSLKLIKINRWSSTRIHLEISKANSRFTLFCGVVALYLVWLTSGTGIIILKSNFWLGMSLTFPIYIFEIIWLKQDHQATELIKYREKIRPKGTLN